MSVTALLTGLWFILWGAAQMAWIDVSLKTLGLLAFIVGLLWIVEQFHPLTVQKP